MLNVYIYDTIMEWLKDKLNPRFNCCKLKNLTLNALSVQETIILRLLDILQQNLKISEKIWSTGFNSSLNKRKMINIFGL